MAHPWWSTKPRVSRRLTRLLSLSGSRGGNALAVQADRAKPDGLRWLRPFCPEVCRLSIFFSQVRVHQPNFAAGSEKLLRIDTAERGNDVGSWMHITATPSLSSTSRDNSAELYTILFARRRNASRAPSRIAQAASRDRQSSRVRRSGRYR